MDKGRTTTLSCLVPPDSVLVALSGITSRSDVEEYESSGARAILVGEALMKSPNKYEFIQSLLGEVNYPQSRSCSTKVKICGVCSIT